MSDRAEAVESGAAGNRFSRRVCNDEQVIAFGLQSHLIRKAVQFNLSYIDRIVIARNFNAYAPGFGNGERVDDKVFRHDDFGHNAKPVVRYKLTGRIDFKRTVARIRVGSVVLLNAEKSFAGDRDIGNVFGILERALLEHSLGCAQAHAVAHLNADRRYRVFRCGRSGKL